ncbi:MAG: hypothetical protein ACREL5_04140 [Gemmatimonadales bacterium]
MPPTSPDATPPASRFPRRNLVLTGIAVVTIVVGYAVLSRGAAEAAAVILVVGYCVLFPLALLV